MDAIALLSSLASDLDHMLNDLRTSPNTRFPPTARLRLLRNERLHSGGGDGGNSLSAGGSDTGGDDDLQALLPLLPTSRDRRDILGRDNLSQSRCSLSSGLDGGDVGDGGSGAEAEGETSDSDCGDGSSETPCGLGLVERLLRSHPVWFLPGIQRAGAVHLLQGKEEGNFVVRGSSQADTMAVSVRLPPDRGPYIEHYLVQASGGRLGLETSANRFDSIPELIAHYAQCCDELPVQLTLPRPLREAPNRQQLSSIALLGQEFWRYPMANPKPLPPLSNQQTTPTTHLSATPLAGTPSDTTSSLSSFTSNGNQLLSPESGESIVLSLSPVEPPVNSRISMTTFKGTPPPMDGAPRAPRPTPPNTLNLLCKTTPGNQLESPTSTSARTPPVPPPRWSKPATAMTQSVVSSPLGSIGAGKPITERQHTSSFTTPVTSNSSPLQGQADSSAANFTVTTTVTFSVEPQGGSTNSQSGNVEIVQAPTLSKRLSPEGECITNCNTLSSQNSLKDFVSSRPSPSSSTAAILSPGPPSSRYRNHRNQLSRASRAKESRHYQESDILESPNVYCRSQLGDKASDYEDIWGPEGLQGNISCSTFRPLTATPLHDSPNLNGNGIIFNRRPDLLPDNSPTVTSLNGNLLSPSGSTASNSSPPGIPPTSRNRLGLTLNTSTPSPTTNSNIERQTSIPVASPNTPSLPIGHRSSPVPQAALPAESGRLSNGRNTPVANITHNTPVFNGQTVSPAPGRQKQGSPFYAEPADSIAIIRRNGVKGIGQRHSEPSTHRDSAFHNSRAPLQRIDSCEELSHIATGSVDNLRPRRIRNRLDPWPVDSSWEFVGADNDADSDGEWNHGRFPTLVQQDICRTQGPRVTVQQIITRRIPGLNFTPDPMFPVPHVRDSSRMSSYDNVEGRLAGHPLSSQESDDGTVFSEPWDSSRWETLLPSETSSVHFSRCRTTISRNEDETVSDATVTYQTSAPQRLATISRSKSCRDRLDPMLTSSVKLVRDIGGPGAQITAYAMHLAADKSTTFAQNVDNFIACTRESREVVPHVVMRNMRQFMSGMKNYLVKHGEREFEKEVERARLQLKSDEFLNLDSILEAVMHRLVVLPLKEHLYALFVDYYDNRGDIKLMADKINRTAKKSLVELGIREAVIPPNEEAMRCIADHMVNLQEAETPLDKLENLLAAVEVLIDSTSGVRYLGADDLLPLLVLVVSRCKMISAEIEAEFMYGLLQPSYLSGEAGYYVVALCSAVHALKRIDEDVSESSGSNSLDWRLNALPSGVSSSVLRVVVPDEHHGSLQTRTLPVRPHTTTKEVCRTIALKARITNPQDYGLFKLIDGEESLLADGDYPQEVRLQSPGKPCMLAYKRIDAKIAWPRAALTSNQ